MAEPLYRCGLVVGKFSPLHRGHQLVIDRALATCEQVVVLSYSVPELPGCEAARRRAWLEMLYPSVTVLVVEPGDVAGWGVVPHNNDPDVVHQAFCAFLCRTLTGKPVDAPVDAIFASEAWGPSFAAHLEADQRTTNPTATVAAVVVDPERRLVAVSGTALRRGELRVEDWLDPRVAATWRRRVVVLGGESTGKTTLVQALATAWGCPAVAEYGRELWEARSGALEPDDLVTIAFEQVAREQQATASHHLVVADTSPLATMFYSEWMFGQVDPRVAELAQRPYDLTLLCAPDIPFEQDGTRVEPPLREAQHLWYLEQLASRGIRFLGVAGSLAERVQQAGAALWHGVAGNGG
jgi:NadR type nicotinamide-nucleotide adenylyltransferase